MAPVFIIIVVVNVAVGAVATICCCCCCSGHSGFISCSGFVSCCLSCHCTPVVLLLHLWMPPVVMTLNLQIFFYLRQQPTSRLELFLSSFIPPQLHKTAGVCWQYRFTGYLDTNRLQVVVVIISIKLTDECVFSVGSSVNPYLY